ncbi:hypothetical protein CKO27_08965 [Thiocystis violacea]|nr:hypothetical protein [Thiocystis violacea]
MAAGSRGVDPACLVSGFLPAFRHLETGEIRLCRQEDGGLSRGHLLDSLPDHWILERDARGRPTILVTAVEPGFLRGIEFWNLENLTHPVLDG